MLVTVIFFLFSVLPGDPAQMMLGQNENSEQLLNIKKKYAFDKPISKQYLLYLNDLSPISIHSKSNEDYTFLKADKYSHYKIYETNSSFLVIKFPFLRTSFTKQGKKVSDIIKDTLPNTLVLAVSSIIIAIIIAVIQQLSLRYIKINLLITLFNLSVRLE